MIEKIINDIDKALEAEAYIAALGLILTLPDICGRVEYPTSKNNERYIQWYDENIGNHENPNCIKHTNVSSKNLGERNVDENAFDLDEIEKIDYPYLSGEVVYQLRCELLHQGNTEINKEKIKDESCKIDSFVIVVEKKKEFEIYADCGGIHQNCVYEKNICNLDNSDNHIEYKPVIQTSSKSYSMNLRRFWQIMRPVVEKYYTDHKDKFNFSKINLLDWDKATKRFQPPEITKEDWDKAIKSMIDKFEQNK